MTSEICNKSPKRSKWKFSATIIEKKLPFGCQKSSFYEQLKDILLHRVKKLSRETEIVKKSNRKHFAEFITNLLNYEQK